MGITVGFIGGGGAGSNLWKLNGAAPNTIALNNLAGVTGIAAPLPGFPETNLLFQEVAPGIIIGGFLHYVTPTKFVLSGVNAQTGAQVGTISAGDINTGAEAYKNAYFDATNKPAIGGFVSDGVDTFNEDTARADSYLREIKNETTEDYTQDEQTLDTRELRLYVAGGEWLRVRIDSQGFKVVDPVAGDMFRVDETGKLYTNQTEAATAIDTTIVGRFPVHDQNGILIGYAPLMIDP